MKSFYWSSWTLDWYDVVLSIVKCCNGRLSFVAQLGGLLWHLVRGSAAAEIISCLFRWWCNVCVHRPANPRWTVRTPKVSPYHLFHTRWSLRFDRLCFYDRRCDSLRKSGLQPTLSIETLLSSWSSNVGFMVVTLKVVRLTHKDIELSQFIWHCQILVTEFWFSISAIPLSKALHFTTLNSLEMGYLPSQWLRRQRSDQVAELYKPFHSEASLLQVFPPVASMGE